MDDWQAELHLAIDNQATYNRIRLCTQDQNEKCDGFRCFENVRGKLRSFSRDIKILKCIARVTIKGKSKGQALEKLKNSRLCKRHPPCNDVSFNETMTAKGVNWNY